MGMVTRKLVFLIIFGLLWAGNTHAAQLDDTPPGLPFGQDMLEKCQLSLKSPRQIEWRGPYSRGYEGGESALHGENSFVEVRHAGRPCNYELKITPADGIFALRGGRGELFFTLGAGNLGGRTQPETPLVKTGRFSRPGAEIEIVPFLVFITPNQDVRAGRYIKQLEVTLYQDNDGIRKVVDTGTVTIIAHVWPRISASIVKTQSLNRRNAQIELGELIPGRRHDLDFEVSANSDYQISVRSENGGNFKHSKADIKIPYTLYLDGKRLDSAELNKGVMIADGSSSTVHDFDLSIEKSPSGEVAGYYSDRLVVTIKAD